MTETESTTQSFESVEKGLKPDLLNAAEFFGVDLPESGKVADIREAFKNEGIDDVQYKVYTDALEAARVAEEEAIEKALAEEEEAKNNPNALASPAKVNESKILIKMKRRNPTMSIRGHKFTTKHPYALVPEKDAEFIIGHYKGFSIALPSEADAYYGIK